MASPCPHTHTRTHPLMYHHDCKPWQSAGSFGGTISWAGSAGPFHTGPRGQWLRARCMKPLQKMVLPEASHCQVLTHCGHLQPKDTTYTKGTSMQTRSALCPCSWQWGQREGDDNVLVALVHLRENVSCPMLPRGVPCLSLARRETEPPKS